MSLLKIIANKTLWKHIGIIAALAAIIIASIFLFLRIYTLHGKTDPVPDFRGLTEQQLQHLIKENDLRYTIIDSIYADDIPRGVVVDQVPDANQHVKKNRNIFFTINAWAEEQVAVPQMTDFSLREARVTLESYGLNVGELIYIPSEYTNLVLGQHYQGKTVQPGTLVPRGTSIDLLVGRGLSEESTIVPDMTGMKLDQAREVAQDLYLNIGAIIYADTVQTQADTTDAFIWRQNPSPVQGETIQLGASIDVWLTTDEDILKDDKDEYEDLFDFDFDYGDEDDSETESQDHNGEDDYHYDEDEFM
ncbi:PASTA domain-containing protein [Marinilabiliaceae bacterium ANBcel2]|nr:PASTA domain-containing protein [Marinilabiliaceae bacterium ANBcel2]